MPRENQEEPTARFAIGNRVRVKLGVRDPDFPDMPLGGWSGKVRAFDLENTPPSYLVEWDRYTRRHIHPGFRSRCKQRDVDWERMWVSENDLEQEQGPPAVIEQPTDLSLEPLDQEEERVRPIRGLRTEAEWQACNAPAPMLDFLRNPMLARLRGQPSQRKFRLFSVACCRRVWDLLRHDRYRQLVELAEQYADGQASDNAVEDAASGAFDGSGGPTEAVFWCCAEDAFDAANFVEAQARPSEPGCPVDRSWKAALVRDLFGNPFHPVTLDPAWRTSTVISIAQAAYQGRSLPSGELLTDHLAVLSDALEDAGCTSPELLEHLRGPGPHVRGCWPIDLILGFH
jgi:hypothetical protein